MESDNASKKWRMGRTKVGIRQEIRKLNQMTILTAKSRDKIVDRLVKLMGQQEKHSLGTN